MSLPAVSDWFNPMLVRDLRQGLRSRGFTLAFLLIQCGLMFLVVLSLIDRSHMDVQQILGRVLQSGVMIFFYIVLPGLALFSLSTEFKDARMDLLQLTSLRARELVTGKWLSLCAQALLVASTLLPYVALRYYFGGVDLAGELAGLAYTISVSLMLLGVAVAISCANSLLLRLLALAAWILVLRPEINQWINGTNNNGWLGKSWDDFSRDWLMLLAAGLPATWVCLEVAASRLAPPVETYDLQRRCVLPLLIVLAFVLLPLEDQFFVSFFGVVSVITICVLMVALCTDPQPYPATYRPYVRWGFFGRLAGRFMLYPGWPSAVILTLLCATIFQGFTWWLTAVMHFTIPSQVKDWLLTFSVLMPPALFFPLVVGWLLLRFGSLGPGVRYLNIVVLCLAVLVSMLLLSTITGSQTWAAFACLLPPNAWALLAANYFEPQTLPFAQLLSLATAVPTVLLATGAAVWRMRGFTALEQEARGDVPAARPKPSLFAAPPKKKSEPIL